MCSVEKVQLSCIFKGLFVLLGGEGSSLDPATCQAAFLAAEAGDPSLRDPSLSDLLLTHRSIICSARLHYQ